MLQLKGTLVQPKDTKTNTNTDAYTNSNMNANIYKCNITSVILQLKGMITAMQSTLLKLL